MTGDTMTSDYIFDSASPQGRQQVGHIEQIFDPITTRFLDDVGVTPGARCAEVGPGSGSICRWLADRVGAAGRVVAVDVATAQLDVPAQVEVYRHDIGAGVPTDGPFDLIHARFVLMHLRDRENLLRMLVDARAPGGLLVLGESPNRPQEVLSAPSDADAELAHRVVGAGVRLTGRVSTAWEWAHEVEQHFVAAGLRDIRGFEYTPMVTGGDAAALLVSTHVAQAEPLLLEEGVTRDEISRFHLLMRDSRFRAWPFMRMVMTAGRKPLDTEVGR